MRPSTLLLALPVLAAAQQVPFLDQVKGWFGRGGVEVEPEEKPIERTTRAKVVPLVIQNITVNNYARKLTSTQPTAEPTWDEWMIAITGRNKTCYGLCNQFDAAFEKSMGGLSLTDKPLKIGRIDCEDEPVICQAWMVNVPSIVYLFVAHPLVDGSPTPETTVRYIDVNRTAIRHPEIVSYHLHGRNKLTEPYKGFWHPFNGPMAQAGLLIPMGYVMWGFSKIPSWAFMIGVSFLSRTMMSRRMDPARRQGQAPAAGQPAAPPAAR